MCQLSVKNSIIYQLSVSPQVVAGDNTFAGMLCLKDVAASNVMSVRENVYG